MNGLPFKIELPFKAQYIKHVEKLDTSVFPTCNVIERTWRIYKKWGVERNMLHIHHAPECKWSILRIRVEKGEIKASELQVD